MTDCPPSADDSVAGLILAGGRARRMETEDKGLMLLCGQPLVQHAIERLRPQVNALRISANRNLESYAAFGLPVISDESPDFLGPLAGIARALATTDSPWLATLPCDAPLAPLDLVSRLRVALQPRGGVAAVAFDGERLQPLFALLHRCVLPGLRAYLDGGGRSVRDWLESVDPIRVDFADIPAAFRNLNTPQDLAALQELMPCPTTPAPTA